MAGVLIPQLTRGRAMGLDIDTEHACVLAHYIYLKLGGAACSGSHTRITLEISGLALMCIDELVFYRFDNLFKLSNNHRI